MKAKELREKSVEELNAELLNLLREQFNLRMQAASGQLQQTHLLKQVRRNVCGRHYRGRRVRGDFLLPEASVYITAILSATFATTPKSCVMYIVVSSNFDCSSRMSCSI